MCAGVLFAICCAFVSYQVVQLPWPRFGPLQNPLSIRQEEIKDKHFVKHNSNPNTHTGAVHLEVSNKRSLGCDAHIEQFLHHCCQYKITIALTQRTNKGKRAQIRMEHVRKSQKLTAREDTSPEEEAALFAYHNNSEQ
jgi:hypothetical protein